MMAAEGGPESCNNLLARAVIFSGYKYDLVLFFVVKISCSED
jgi:hypothetical protein